MNTELYENQAISVLVRLHDTSDRILMNLEACIFMLFNQAYKPTEVVLCLQRFTQAQVEMVEDIVRCYPWAESGNLEPVVINVFDDTRKDIRSKLLNEGIKAAHGRYVAMLDYDDIIYGSAYIHLISGLKRAEAAIAFAGIKRVDVMPFDKFVYRMRKYDVFHGKDKFDMFYTNFCPIHSFVLDRNKIDPSDLYFEEFLSKNEDYDFLLRILSKYDSNFYTRNKFVGEYQVRTDGSNTIGSEYRNDPVADMEWANAIEHVHQLMKKLTINVSLWDIHLLKTEAKNVARVTAKDPVIVEPEAAQAEAKSFSDKFHVALQFLSDRGGISRTVRKDHLKGFVEEFIPQDDGSLNVKGWAADTINKTGISGVALEISGKIVACDTAVIDRLDVQTHHDLLDERCGFNVTVPSDIAGDITNIKKHLRVFAITEGGQVFKIEFLKGP